MAWEIDNTHSQVTFSVRHMMISTVKGHFNLISGQLHIDEQTPANSWIEAEADVASVDTRDERRDGHLRSPDFFDVENYPKLTFKSTKVEKVGDEEYKVTGDLTVRGISKPVTFDAEYSGQIKDLYGMQRAGLTAKTTVNRKDFNLNWNAALEGGGVLVSDNVKIEIDLAAVYKPATTDTAATDTAATNA
jgi:polyisoprenoid-binding protein YceI